MAERLSTKDFIDHAISTHGYKYDYSESEYISAAVPLKIICHDHGPFWQRPSDHKKGKGCIECGKVKVGNSKRMGLEEFITSAIEKHGNRYDYSSVIYVNNRTKVSLKCSLHGDFLQSPNNHLGGRGCPKCADRERVKGTIGNIHRFKTDAERVHGKKYDYSLVSYINNHTKVEIVCPEHGAFMQAPFAHLQGCGCPRCSGVGRVSEHEWIQRAVVVHGGRYSYSRAGYAGVRDYVTITCPEHGDFRQVAYSHTAGRGCPHCSGRVSPTTDEWIEMAIEVHGDKYSYARAVYTTSKHKLVITCKEHGDFSQRASHHLAGVGCSRCMWDRSQPTSVYLLKMGRFVKIGVSIDPTARLARLNVANPSTATLLQTWVLPDFPAAQEVEFAAHAALAPRHAGLSGFDGATEWFQVNPAHASSVIEALVAGGICQLSFKLRAA